MDDVVMTQCVALDILERANLSNKLEFISQGLRGGSDLVSREALMGFIRLADAGGAAALDTVEAVAEEVNNDRLARIAQGYLSPVGPMIRPATPSAYDPEAAIIALKYMIYGQDGNIRGFRWHVDMDKVRDAASEHYLEVGFLEHNSIAGSIVLQRAGVRFCNNDNFSHNVWDGESLLECGDPSHHLSLDQRGYNSLSFSGTWTGEYFSESEAIQDAIDLYQDGWGGDGMHKYHTLLDPVPEIGTRSDRGLYFALENDNSVMVLNDSENWDDYWPFNDEGPVFSTGNIIAISFAYRAGDGDPVEYCIYVWVEGLTEHPTPDYKLIGFSFAGVVSQRLGTVYMGGLQTLRTNVDHLVEALEYFRIYINHTWKVFSISHSPAIGSYSK